MNLPGIIYSQQEGLTRASFGLALQTLLPETFLRTPTHPLMPTELWRDAHQRNVRLLEILGRWPHPCVVELHIASHPSLDYEKRGWNEIRLLWHVQGNTRAEVTEAALSDSIQLEATLTSFWPSAHFSPLPKDELKRCFQPFLPESCLLVGRRRGAIGPSHPFPADKMQIGFQVSQLQAEKGVKSVMPKSFLHVYPWVPSSGENWSALLTSLLCLPAPRWIVVRMGTGLRSDWHKRAIQRLEASLEVCERCISGSEREIVSTTQAIAMRDASFNRCAQLLDSAVFGAVLLFAPGSHDEVTANLLGQTISGDHARRQIDNLLEGGFSVQPIQPRLALQSFSFFEEEPLTAEEGACAFRLPIINGDHDLGLEVSKCRTVELPASSSKSPPSPKHRLGINVHRGASRAIEVDVSDRLHHQIYIGATGVGKSTGLLASTLADARAGFGLAIIDPPGELADDFLARFPKERLNDLIIVDFDDRQYPVPINLLAYETPEERDLLIDTLLSTLLAIYKNADMFGPVFESNFRSGLRLLLGDCPRTDFTPTLLELPLVFRNRKFREYLMSTVSDEDIKGAIEEADRVNWGDGRLENLAPYITSKFSRYLQDTQLRRIVGHGKMALDFRAIMDEGKIVVFKLAQGRLGKNVSDVMVSQIVARFRLAAMSRANVIVSDRRPFFLYSDEFQVIADENFTQMLSECRKYKLGLVLANQYARQLREKGVLEAVLSNVGIIACYRVAAEDAELLAPVFAPNVTQQDLVSCPNWNGYMKLRVGRAPTAAFSFQNLPDSTIPNPAWARHLAELSRQKWGISASEIQKAIKNRAEFICGLPESESKP